VIACGDGHHEERKRTKASKILADASVNTGHKNTKTRNRNGEEEKTELTGFGCIDRGSFWAFLVS
jgi:hypothetical protein